MKKLVLLIAFTLSAYAGSLSAGGSSLSASSKVFSKHSLSLGVKFGSASVGNEEYTILGLNGSYFIFDDFCVGLGYEQWYSGDPDIKKLTAESTYYIPASEEIRPYLGILYRRIMISDGRNADVNAYGYRAGMAFVQGRFVLSAGIVQERYESSRILFNDTETYMEASVGITF